MYFERMDFDGSVTTPQWLPLCVCLSVPTSQCLFPSGASFSVAPFPTVSTHHLRCSLSHCLILCYIRVVSTDRAVAQGGISEEELAAVVGDEKAGSIINLIDTNRDGESLYVLPSKMISFL